VTPSIDILLAISSALALSVAGHVLIGEKDRSSCGPLMVGATRQSELKTFKVGDTSAQTHPSDC
jgi:hypothetical protein